MVLLKQVGWAPWTVCGALIMSLYHTTTWVMAGGVAMVSITQEPCDLEMGWGIPKENEEFCYYTRIANNKKENPHDHHSKDFILPYQTPCSLISNTFPYSSVFCWVWEKGLYYKAASGRAQGLFICPHKFYKDPLCEHSSLGADGVDTTGPEE